MAARSNITRAEKRANSIDLGKIISTAPQWEARKKRQVKIFCDVIAGIMEEIHGGSFRIQIEHDVGLISVTRSFRDRPIDPADLREAI